MAANPLRRTCLKHMLTYPAQQHLLPRVSALPIRPTRGYATFQTHRSSPPTAPENRVRRGPPQNQRTPSDDEWKVTSDETDEVDALLATAEEDGPRGEEAALRLEEILENPDQLNPYVNFRVVPASASYFTALPRFTDDLLELESMLRRYELLPKVRADEARRTNWLTYEQYTVSNTEPIRRSAYARLLRSLRLLNRIHPALKPDDVDETLARFKRATQPGEIVAKTPVLDGMGRMRAVGRRKSSHAVAWLVDGTGEVLVNGKVLGQLFTRSHDRESALWALKATARMDKYNVWVVVKGGGTTGQAEAITLAVAKALLAHEPALKPALRRAGVITRDTRKVERKKPGKLKARKMPAWVKR